MSLTVNFRTTTETIKNRTFPVMQGISIFGNVSGTLGLPDFGATVQISIRSDAGNELLTDIAQCNMFGDYDFYFVTPSIDMKATITILAIHAAGGMEKLVIPIAIGNENPNPMNMNIPFSIWDYLPYILIAGVGIIIYNKL